MRWREGQATTGMAGHTAHGWGRCTPGQNQGLAAVAQAGAGLPQGPRGPIWGRVLQHVGDPGTRG